EATCRVEHAAYAASACGDASLPLGKSAHAAERSQRTMKSQFPHLSFLDCIRPEPGWQTDCALVSTYSAQVPVIAAVLLALSGEVDETGSGSRVGLVRALTGLRGKLHVVLQSGRLTQGRRDG